MKPFDCEIDGLACRIQAFILTFHYKVQDVAMFVNRILSSGAVAIRRDVPVDPLGESMKSNMSCAYESAMSRRRNIAPIVLLSVALGGLAFAQQPATPPSAKSTLPLLVGYLPAYKGASLANLIHGLDLSSVTHLSLAFGDPPQCNGACTSQSDMTFSLKGQSDTDIDAVVNAAHAAGVKVLLSIGGGGGDQRIIQFYNAGLSAELVASLNTFVRAHKLDGVDVDIEDPSNMGAPYAEFVSTLISTFHPEGKLVTAAVAKYLQDSMPDSALHQFDLIFVMNYSSYESATTSLQFYEKDKKVPKNEIVLGVPFFASNTSDTKEEDYRTILAAYPNAWKVDVAGGGALDDGQEFHYIGESTLARETQLGKGYGGIMIWEMLGDADAPHSLLRIISDGLAKQVPATTNHPCVGAAEKPD
jgi:chitinase